MDTYMGYLFEDAEGNELEFRKYGIGDQYGTVNIYYNGEEVNMFTDYSIGVDFDKFKESCDGTVEEDYYEFVGYDERLFMGAEADTDYGVFELRKYPEGNVVNIYQDGREIDVFTSYEIKGDFDKFEKSCKESVDEIIHDYSR